MDKGHSITETPTPYIAWNNSPLENIPQKSRETNRGLFDQQMFPLSQAPDCNMKTLN